jgi:hypothetical protein
MNHVDDVIPALNDVFERLKEGTVTHNVAGQMNNAVGKMIAIVKIQLQYSIQREEKPDIEFLRPRKQ